MIGHSVLRVDGREKLTGAVRYGQDLKFAGMLYARVRHSDYPRAEILEVDTSRARRVKGVVAVFIASALLRENSAPSEEEIRVAISGNLCRCTGFTQIVEAVQSAAVQDHGDWWLQHLQKKS